MNDFLKGTGVALATPFMEDLTIDYKSLEKLLKHVSDGGVEYLVVMGTTGEAPTLNWSEKMDVLDFIIANNPNQLPIVFGLGGNNTNEILEKLTLIQNKNIQGILSASPNYNKPSQEGIYQHYIQIAEKSHVPVLLYNVPGRTASKISTDTTIRLSLHLNIVGTKEASGDLIQCMDIQKNTDKDFLLISGDDALTLPILSIGGSGVISVLANLQAENFSKMVRLCLAEKYPEARKINDVLLEAYDLATKEGNPVSIKAGLEAANICNRAVRLPLVKSSPELVTAFANHISK